MSTPSDELPTTSSSSPSTSRLYELAKQRQARKVLLSRLLPEECTFSPQTNPTTTRPESSPSTDAYERLHSQALALKLKHQALSEKVGGEECTFSPTITKKAQKLLEASTRLREEKGLNAGEALYRSSLERRAVASEKNKRLAQEGLTFQPKINPRSSEKHSDRPFSERLYDPSSVSRRRQEDNKCVGC